MTTPTTPPGCVGGEGRCKPRTKLPQSAGDDIGKSIKPPPATTVTTNKSLFGEPWPHSLGTKAGRSPSGSRATLGRQYRAAVGDGREPRSRAHELATGAASGLYHIL